MPETVLADTWLLASVVRSTTLRPGMFPLWSSPSTTSRPETALAVTLTASPSGRRTVTSPLTVVASIEVLPDVTSRATSPETEFACTRVSAPEAANSPDTVLSDEVTGVVAHDDLAGDAVGLEPAPGAVDDDRAGDRRDRGGGLDAGHEPLRAHRADLRGQVARDGDADVGAVLVAEVAELLEEALPPVERELVADPQLAVAERHLERAAVDAVHLDPGAGLVVRDDVDATPDQLHAQRAHLVDVDDLRAADDPGLFRHDTILSRYVVFWIHDISRYVATQPLPEAQVLPCTPDPDRLECGSGCQGDHFRTHGSPGAGRSAVRRELPRGTRRDHSEYHAVGDAEAAAGSRHPELGAQVVARAAT